jgi:predicted DNA-binding transcriptional regulator YafY
MADPAVRLLRLLGLLQRRTAWSGGDLAERLDIDPRSVRRDVGKLRSLGYQIDGTPGVSGGYRLRGGNDVPPMFFEDDEAMAVAVVLGVSAGAAVPGIERGALSALAKLDRLLPPRLRTQLTTLRAATVSLVPTTEVISTENLLLFAQACDSHQLATFAYRAHSGRHSMRRAEPYRLVATDRRWYLVAYDLDRGDWRTFRVDRTSSVVVRGHTFEPRELDDPAQMVAEAISTAAYDLRSVVRIDARAEDVAPHVPPYVGVVEPEGNCCTVRAGADDFEWLAGFFVGLGLPFEVLEPVGFRDYMAKLGQQLMATHGTVGIAHAP